MIAGLCIHSGITVAEEVTPLFEVDPVVKSKDDNEKPMHGSIKEWDILLDLRQVNQEKKTLIIQFPEYDYPLVFKQSRFRSINEDHLQWFGKASTESGAEVGYMIINLIEDRPNAIINVNTDTFEIYTNPTVGTRLAKVDNRSFFHNDAKFSDYHHHEKEIAKSVSKLTSNLVGEEQANDISYIDVLVVLDE